MPIYTYQCAFGHTQEVTRTIEERNNPVYCKTCKRIMIRKFEIPQLSSRQFPYVHHLLDDEPVVIKNRRQEKDEHEKRNCGQR